MNKIKLDTERYTTTELAAKIFKSFDSNDLKGLQTLDKNELDTYIHQSLFPVVKELLKDSKATQHLEDSSLFIAEICSKIRNSIKSFGYEKLYAQL